MNPVDAMLRHARQLLGTMNPVQLDVAFPASPPHPASWDSDAAAAAADTGTLLAERAADLQAAHQAVAAAIAEANEISRNAHVQLTAVENAWASNQAAADPAAATDDAQAGLLHAAQQHVLDVTAVVQTAAEQFQAAAQRIAAAKALLTP